MAKKRRVYGTYRGVVTDNRDPDNIGRVRVRVPEILGEVDSWALPCAPYGGKRVGFFAVPPVDAEVWVAFEGGDVARPIVTGCMWSGDEIPPDESGAPATPDVKMQRSERGLLLALHDETQTIVLSDQDGANLLTIEVERGQVTVKATTKVVIDAPRIELVAGASHPLVLGDGLLSYLSEVVWLFNAHQHQGQTAGPTPVTPSPPVPPLPPPTHDLLSTAVKAG